MSTDDLSLRIGQLSRAAYQIRVRKVDLPNIVKECSSFHLIGLVHGHP